MKSSHLHIKEKMALVTREGLTRGRMILMNMEYMVHPSILADNMIENTLAYLPKSRK